MIEVLVAVVLVEVGGFKCVCVYIHMAVLLEITVAIMDLFNTLIIKTTN